MIYHYTSIDTLSLILKHKKIKFNRLDFVNDPLEGFSSNFLDSQKLAYVSCFTKRKDDSIPMWAMYTEKFKGIRIGFPQNIFGEVEQERSGLKIRKLDREILDIESSFLAGPEDIVYKKSIEEIDHKIFREFNNPTAREKDKGISFNPYKIGKFKLQDWEFEQECRFLILNIDFKFVTGINSEFFTKHKEEIDSKLNSSPTELYVPFKESILSEVEILMGPKTTEADRIIVEALVAKYAPSIIKIEKSNKKIN